jgi:hypothetical protein
MAGKAAREASPGGRAAPAFGTSALFFFRSRALHAGALHNQPASAHTLRLARNTHTHTSPSLECCPDPSRPLAKRRTRSSTRARAHTQPEAQGHCRQGMNLSCSIHPQTSARARARVCRNAGARAAGRQKSPLSAAKKAVLFLPPSLNRPPPPLLALPTNIASNTATRRLRLACSLQKRGASTQRAQQRPVSSTPHTPRASPRLVAAAAVLHLHLRLPPKPPAPFDAF